MLTCPGWHTAVPDLHRHLRAGTRFPRADIYVSRPAYLCLGRHMWAQGRLQHSPGRHICVSAEIYVGGLDYFNSGLFRPKIAGSGPEQQNPGRSGPAQWKPGAGRGIFIRVGRLLLHPGRPIPASSPQPLRQAIPAGSQASAGPKLPLPAGPEWLGQRAPLRLGRLSLFLAGPGQAEPGWADASLLAARFRLGLRPGWPVQTIPAGSRSRLVGWRLRTCRLVPLKLIH
jgi:hypothetical protein